MFGQLNTSPSQRGRARLWGIGGPRLAKSRLSLLGATSLLAGLLLAQCLSVTSDSRPRRGGDDGAAALIDAIDLQDAKAVERLLRAGVPAETTDEHGWSALQHAAMVDEPRIAEHLIRHGAPVNAGDLYTPLSCAIVSGHVRVVQMLLRNGADPNARNRTGVTPLMIATMCRRADIIRCLVAAGADVNADGPAGETALHLAAPTGCTDTVNALLHSGADAARRNRVGETPADLARAADRSAETALLDAASREAEDE